VLGAAREAGIEISGEEWGESGMVVWCDPTSVEFRLGNRTYTQLVHSTLLPTHARPTVRYMDKCLATPASPLPGQTTLSRSGSPEVRPGSTTPTPSGTEAREFADRLEKRGVTLKAGEKKEGGKKTRRDSGYVSAAEMRYLRTMQTPSPSRDLAVQG